jgi:hypothetical protein
MLLLISIRWDYVSELRPLTVLLFIPRYTENCGGHSKHLQDASPKMKQRIPFINSLSSFIFNCAHFETATAQKRLETGIPYLKFTPESYPMRGRRIAKHPVYWDLKLLLRRVWSSVSSGMYCRVLNWMSTDVSEVLSASIIRAMTEAARTS